MTLKETMDADVDAVFLQSDEFAIAVAYTPEGGALRNIKGILHEDVSEHFESGSADLDFDVFGLEISAVDDVTGVLTPGLSGRGGNAGDTLTFAGSADTWYVRKILQEGRMSATKMHLLLIANSQAAFFEMA